MTNPHELLRAANPVPDCPPPPIEGLWARLDRDPPARTDPQPMRPASGRLWLERLTVGGLVSVAAALAVAAVLVLGGRSSSPTATLATAPAAASPTRALVDILGVLRRPQTSADRNPGFIQRLEHLGPGFRGSPVLPLLRLATTTPWGEQVFLVPFRPATHQPITIGRPSAQLSRRLRRLARQRVERSLARLSPRQRARDLALLKRDAARLRRGAERSVGLFAAGNCCATAANIEAGRDWSSGGRRGSAGKLVNDLIIIVPDGVAKVTVRLSPPSSRQRPRILAADVHGNVAAFLVPWPVESLSTERMTWYGSSGNVLRPIG